MVKKYFALSYNNSKGTPNWVSWRLTADDIGSAPRVAFYPDEDLPTGFVRITPKDYTGSGFDRGHMCNHSDRSATPDSSHATFVMSNMVPQSPYVNQKAWDQLEAYCRQLAQQGPKHPQCSVFPLRNTVGKLHTAGRKITRITGIYTDTCFRFPFM